jgi:hypothetical protein
VELISQRRRRKWLQKPRRQDPLLGQEDRHGQDYAVGKDRAGRSPSAGGRHLHHPRHRRVEQVGQAPTGDHKGEGKKGSIGLCYSHTPLVLRDVTPCLRLVGCSLRVVGLLLQDMGPIPRDINGVPQEARHLLHPHHGDHAHQTHPRKGDDVWPRPRPRQGEKKTDTFTSANFVSSSKHFFNSFSA